MRSGAGVALLLLCSAGCARAAKLPDAPTVTDVGVASKPATSDTAAQPSDSLLVNEDEYQGWRYYHIYCARCHGQDALGSANAADLRHSISEEGGIAVDSFLVIVRRGSADNVEMKGFADLLEDARVGQIYQYIRARSEGRLAMGRPHRRQPAP